MWTGLAEVLHQIKIGVSAADRVLAGEARGPTRRVTLLPIGAADGQALVGEAARARAAVAQLITVLSRMVLPSTSSPPAKLDS